MRLTLLISSLLCSISLSGQATFTGQANFEITKQYNINDGLSHNYINRIREDSRGFLWLATWEGLNRFDGQEFKKYYHERNNPNSLPSDVIQDILEYQPGRLLIGTSNGLGVLNTFTGQFENDKIQFEPLKAGSETVVTKLEKDPEGHIWVNHGGELDVFDQDLNYLYRFTDLGWAKSIKGITINLQDWVIDQKGRIWIPAESDGITIIDLKDKSILNYKYNPNNLAYLSHRSIRSLLLDGDSILWVSTPQEGLMKYDILTGKQLAKLFYEGEYFEELLKTDHGTFLFTIWRYCYELNPHTMEVSRVFEFGKKEHSNESVHFSPLSTCRTKSDTYWFGTQSGLFKLNKRIPLKEINLANDPIWWGLNYLFSRSGLIYLRGDKNLLAVFDRDQGELKRYTIPASISKRHSGPISEDRSNQIWIGSDEGVRRFDPVTKIFDTPSFLPDQLKTGLIRMIFCDRDGYIWIGTQDPFCLYSIFPETNEITTIPDSILLPFTSREPRGYLQQIHEDNNGSIWMGSRFDGGILCFDKKKNIWISYPKSDQNKAIISNTGIQDMWPDASGNIWLARTVLGGLIRYDYRNDSISFITREDGLITNDILNFDGDDQGNLWLSSPLGISRYITSKQQVSGHFAVEYTPNFNEYGVIVDPYTKNLVLNGNNRFLFLDPEKMVDTFPPPRPILDGVTINNEIIQLDPYHPIINLNNTQRNISIAFTAINFSNTEKLQFAYTLSGEGEADELTYTTTSRFVQYSMLSPGKYIFKVKVSDGSGRWSANEDLLSFTIHPPFWKSTWFVLSLGFIFALITLALIRRRIANIRHEAELKQRIAETEMMALRAQMNPHFIFNCINSIDALIQNNDKYRATLYLNKFAKLIRNILDSSKMSDMTIARDLETLKLYIELEQFRNENKFTADIHADPALLQGDYKIPPLIIQPYVENAIIHGLRNRVDNEGKLTVTLRKADGYLQYSVEDNGVGRKNTLKESSNEKKSYGMEMSSERIRLFNQEEHASVTITDLEVNGKALGTRVDVLLKMV
jgi:ligand-binding sensor domain-containing protein